MVERIGLAARQRLLHDYVDGDPVLRVHHDERAVVPGRCIARRI